ncbi:MAG: hypothetical protein BIFFINMI_00797 [Phycisphaerae bacterium]|nr:hypothetical protein [Phycisphaerae bacterium]
MARGSTANPVLLRVLLGAAAWLFGLGVCTGSASRLAADDLPATAQPEPVSDLVAGVRRDTQWLCQAPSRLVGSPGHDEAVQRLADELRAVPGVRVWEQSFDVVVPRTREARLTVDGPGGPRSAPIYPIWPASVRLDVTGPAGIHGRLIYVGEGNHAELPARSLRGRIAVMNMTGGGNWETVWNAGATAILLLGSPDESVADAHSHLSRLPIYVPRFYIPSDSPLAEALKASRLRPLQAATTQTDRPAPRTQPGDPDREADLLEGTVVCRADWATARATNLYALLPARAGTRPKPAIAVVAPIDAMSIVPDLAPGADAAVDAAAALGLLRHFAADRLSRPMLFAFADAYGINLLGPRHMLGALGYTPKQTRVCQEEDEEQEKTYREHAQLLDELLKGGSPADGSNRRLGSSKYAELQRYVKDEVAWQVVKVDAELEPRRVRRFGLEAGPQRDALEKEVAVLEAEKQDYYAAQLMLLGSRTYDRQSVKDKARATWGRAVARIRGQLAEQERRREVRRSDGRLREEMLDALGIPFVDPDKREGDGPFYDTPIAFLLGLDLSDGGLAAGPRFQGDLLKINETSSGGDFARWLLAVNNREKEIKANLRDGKADSRGLFWPGRLALAVDLMPVAGQGDSVDSFTVGSCANITAPARSFGIRATTWATLDAVRRRVDTPQDRFGALDWDRLGPQIDATRILIERLVDGDAPKFSPQANVVPNWMRARGSIVDQAPGEPVARLPMPDYLATLVLGSTRGGSVSFASRPRVEGVRTLEFVRTGTDGQFYFDYLPGHVYSQRAAHLLQAWQLDENDGSIRRGVDMNRVGKGVRLDLNVTTGKTTPRRAVVFTCREVSLVGLFDPRFLIQLPQATLQDAERGGKPQRMNYGLTGGQFSALLDPDIRWQLILRAGATQNRMALLNVDTPEKARGKSTREAMEGFALDQRLTRSPLYQGVLDFYNLDAIRVEKYRRAGIVMKVVDDLRGRTAEQFHKIDAAMKRDDGGALYKSVTGAMSDEVRAYQAIQKTANDVVRAAIFLLLALVPFSFAMERLLIASPYIYRQLGGIAVIFAIMTAILWSFHPAFRISSQPLMIIMAFGIIFMSLMVMSIVYQKFRVQMEEIRSGRAEAAGARTSRGGLAVSALRLGIANMRKRKVRTLLTGSTVVLITFALLCFTSVSSYSDQKELSLDSAAPFTGLFIRQPQDRQMPSESLAYLRVVMGESCTVPRYWLVNAQQPQWKLHVRNPRLDIPPVSLLGAVGLDGRERETTAIRSVVGAAAWDRFSAEGGCLLAAPVAEQLQVEVGQTVFVAGAQRVLQGVYDVRQFDEQVRDMTGESILPTNYSALPQEQQQLLASQDIEQLSEELATGQGLEPSVNLKRLGSDQVIILPADVVRELPGASLRAIAVTAPGPEQAKTMATDLASRLAFPIYYAGSEGVKVVAATGLTPQAPKSMFIMLVIAGLIIFNTMLNSIAERKREIHIYTSLGLAPLHVGVLFVAEAMTYGLMGAIFGYVVGQGAATALSHFGWLGGITLNYSGTQAIWTMLLVMVVVVLSAIVPAILAGKVAAPSEQMKWRVPDPVDDVIRDSLPFTVTGQTANGVVMFLHDYMEAHREGSIGHFSTDNLRLFPSDATGLLGIEATVWLAPYDLGVRQDVRLTIRRTAEENVLEIDVELRRGAGQVSSWWKLNRVFLGDLRRQLLGWRKLKTARILEYIAQGTEWLNQVGASGPLPVPPTTPGM